MPIGGKPVKKLRDVQKEPNWKVLSNLTKFASTCEFDKPCRRLDVTKLESTFQFAQRDCRS